MNREELITKALNSGNIEFIETIDTLSDVELESGINDLNSEAILKAKIKELEKKLKECEESCKKTTLYDLFVEQCNLGKTPKELAKKYTEKELIEMGTYVGFSWTTKGSKADKVKLLIETIK